MKRRAEVWQEGGEWYAGRDYHPDPEVIARYRKMRIFDRPYSVVAYPFPTHAEALAAALTWLATPAEDGEEA